MDKLALFGLFAVSAMMLCYAHESRSRWCILGFAVASVLGAIYGFLQGGRGPSGAWMESGRWRFEEIFSG